MLDAGNRQALTQQLRPPAGFRLVHAVGTTFTLDMTSALSVPLSFVAGSGEQFTNPVAVLTALRKVSDRVDIFCQAGNIRVPQGASDLLALLEPMVHQVSVRGGGLFHPKVWVLEFENDDGERRYRFLCGSRNLTPDTSWDLLVRLDGAPTDTVQPGNTPLQEFLTALCPLASVPPEQSRVNRIHSLADRIATVEWELPEHISLLAFRPLGVQTDPEPESLVSYLRNPQTAAGLNPDPAAAKTIGYKKLVISPFLDDILLGRILDTTRTDKTHVFSRADQLDLIAPNTISNKRFCFRSFDDTITPEMGDDGASTSGDDLTGLHAKAYFCDYGFQTHVLLGSSNATNAGFNKNVEFLVEMRGLKSKIGVDTILTSLEDVPFNDYSGTGGQQRSDDDEMRFHLDSKLREAAARIFLLDAVPEQGPDTSGLYAVTLEHDWTPPARLSATVRLVTLRTPVFEVGGPSEPGASSLRYRNVPLADVTPYLVLSLTDPESELTATAVVQGVLRTDPDGRLDEIVARQLDNPDKLRQFLLLFLSPEDAPPGAGFAGLPWRFGAGYQAGASAGLFETLVTALENPNASEIFSELEPVIQRLVKLNGESDDVLQLHALWSAATEALQMKETPHGL
ncbi:phospholipase D family protein [Arthrobacter gengyunqii]|nr:phospholipase D family protein [Arthrobacter gengyunqii]UOY96806.1 phospholipase D family protein [Arthrobacter gengyunqii]